MLLAMAEVWVLLLGEIDLSAGFVGGVGGDHRGRGRHERARRLAVVGRLRGRIAALRAHRHVLGNDHHAPGPAVVRGDAGRPARIPGRDAVDPRQRWDVADQRQHPQRPGERPAHAGRRVDRDDRPRHALRSLRVVPRRPAPKSGSRRAPGRPDDPEDRRDGRRRRGARPDLQHGPRGAGAHQGRAVGTAHRPRRVRRVDLPARAHEVRPLRLRDRRQLRGGAAAQESASPGSAPPCSCSARSRPASPASSTRHGCDRCRPTSTAASSCSTRSPPRSSAVRACSAVGARWSTRCSAAS